MTAQEWIAMASECIPRLDAEVLAAEALGVTRERLITEPWVEVPTILDEWLARRVQGESVAVITGHKEFFGMDFLVTREVLVPRPETEVLVEAAIRLAPAGVLVDVGTGSGNIASCLARHRSDIAVVATDLSPKCLAVATRNFTRLRAKVSCVVGDLLSPFASSSLAAVVSNPPYIAPGDPRLEPAVASWEPPLALYAQRGIAVIEAMVEGAWRCLQSRGLLAFEFGLDQEDTVLGLLQGWERATLLPDLAGIPRVATGFRP